ncbi:hypothetical protein CEV32_4873 [Brucella rhizosphaerae]|uniref:Uncharacterized protein n=1 Tax=Brucella rhizosphaerae TaxID=571254 RepID=A0A256FL73_9HYPH|nr:hypothetical protein CEV32_4873 [Brucella rhizosphaerae]
MTLTLFPDFIFLRPYPATSQLKSQKENGGAHMHTADILEA